MFESAWVVLSLFLCRRDCNPGHLEAKNRFVSFGSKLDMVSSRKLISLCPPSAPRSQIYATASFQPSHVTHIGNFNAAGQPKERTASADNSDDSAGDDDPSDDDTPGVLRQAPQHNRVSDLQSTTEESKKSKRQKNKNPEYLCRNCGRNDSPEWRKVCAFLILPGNHGLNTLFL
jgi:hypothetical protein